MVFATCFLISDEVIARARETNLTIFDLSFRFQIDDETFINDPVHPLGAIGYTSARMDKMIEESGLKRQGEFLKGAWSGFYENPDDGQDGVVLYKPENTESP